MQNKTLQDLFLESIQNEIPTQDRDFMSMVDKTNIGAQLGAIPMSMLDNPIGKLQNSPKMDRLLELFAMLTTQEQQPTQQI